MNYRSRWQQRRRQEARRRGWRWLAAAVLAPAVALIVNSRQGSDEVWRYDFRVPGPVYFTADSGALFCALPAGRAEALRISSGRRQWRAPLKRSLGFGAPPAVSGSCLAYVNDAGTICAVSRATGDLLWEVETGGPVRCPPVADGDAFFVGSDDGNLYALAAADGIERWRFDAESPINSGCVVARGMVTFATADGRVMGVYKDSGLPAPWRQLFVGMPIFAKPTQVADLVAIASDGGWACLMDPWTGAIPATMTAPRAGLVRTPLVVDAGSIYLGTTDGLLAAYELRKSTGGQQLPLRWVKRIGGELSAGLALDAKYLYCANGSGSILVLDKSTGNVRKRWQCHARVQGSLVVADGLVIAGTAEGQVVAFRAPVQ